MRTPSRQPLARTVRLVVWVVLCALASYGLTGVLQEFAASRHKHRAMDSSFQAMAGWVDFRRVGHSAQPLLANQDHGVFETHHHALNDPTVLILDGLDTGLSGDATSVLSSAGGHAGALITGSLFTPANIGGAAWLDHAPQRFLSAELRLRDRPPRA